MSLRPRACVGVLIGLLALIASHPPTARARDVWVGSWAAAQQLPEPNNALPASDLTGATLRQIVHLSLGGPRFRVRLSNVFGTAPLHVAAAHVAIARSPGSPRVEAGTDRVLTFAGQAAVTIPAGAQYWSDPVESAVASRSDVAVSLYFDAAPQTQTSHPGSRGTSYLVHGDQTASADLPDARRVEHWFELSGVDVAAAPGAFAVATLGDSITDGHGATTDGNDRWPDVLAARLLQGPGGAGVGVLNIGIGGNRVLLDGLGPNALARFDRDVLGQSGVRTLILLEGINDIGMLTRDAPSSPEAHQALVRDIFTAYGQIVARAHDHGVRVIGGAITPFMGSDYYHPTGLNEADRQALNAWIRAPGHFDAVADFDQAVRDPARPERLAAPYDSGDHLHPSPAGYRAMAEAVPVGLLGIPAAAGAREIALTFDDLPAHSTLPPGVTRLDVARGIISALKAVGAPKVYGFVNGIQLEREPDSAAVLPAWRKAGFPLANHTWSHLNLNTEPLEAWEADVVKDEPLLETQMGRGDWRWLRFPFLAEGDGPGTRAASRAFLASRGYRIAQVTMSFGDYAFNEPYARCMARGDQAAVDRLERGYLQAAEDEIVRARSMSRTLYDRDIPYVLLMHLGAFDARMLPRLLSLYQARGFSFVTLPHAERDPFYGPDLELTGPLAPDTLEAMMAARGLHPPAGQDLAWLDDLCR